MIREFSACELPAGVDYALRSDAAVIRSLITHAHAEAMSAVVPKTGKTRVYLSPRLQREDTLTIPALYDARRAIQSVVSQRLGRFASLLGAYVMRPDMLRAGRTHAHLDGRGAIVSGSLNLDSAGSSTRFFAHRLVEANAPYSTMEATWEGSSLMPEEMAQCELGVGDMVIVARGAVHGSMASKQRRSATYRVRGFVLGDIR